MRSGVTIPGVTHPTRLGNANIYRPWRPKMSKKTPPPRPGNPCDRRRGYKAYPLLRFVPNPGSRILARGRVNMVLIGPRPSRSDIAFPAQRVPAVFFRFSARRGLPQILAIGSRARYHPYEGTSRCSAGLRCPTRYVVQEGLV